MVMPLTFCIESLYTSAKMLYNIPMMTTLEEAIERCKEVAEKCGNCGCSLEHRQLADWLEELRLYRQMASNGAIDD